MATMTVNVPDEVYRGFRERADQKGRSVEDEVSEYIATAVPGIEKLERGLHPSPDLPAS